MQRQFTLPIIVILVSLTSCKGKDEPITFKPSERLSGDYTLTDGTSIEEAPEQAFLMGAIPKAIKQKHADQLDTFIQRSTALGFKQEEFAILYQATHQALSAMRYRFIQSLIADATPNGEFVADLLTAPLIPSIADDINVTLETTESKTDPEGLDVALKINQTYTLPNCTLGAESCNVAMEIDVSIDFPWPHPSIATTDNGHTLKLDNATPTINTFKVSNQHASFELSLDYSYIGTLHSSIPNNNAGSQTRKTEIDKLRADFSATYINDTQKADGSEGHVKISGPIITSFTLLTLMTDFDANSITVDDVDSIVQMELTTVEVE